MCTSKLTRTSSFDKDHGSCYVENLLINSSNFHESLSRIPIFFLDPRSEDATKYSTSIRLSAFQFVHSFFFCGTNLRNCLILCMKLDRHLFQKVTEVYVLKNGPFEVFEPKGPKMRFWKWY